MTTPPSERVRADPPPVTADDFPPGRWRARWIWCEPPRLTMDSAIGATPAADERYACFRRVFELTKVPDRVPARVTADSRYVLSVNGVTVARGPVRGNGRLLHYDPVDLAPCLREGRNAVTIVARFYGRPTPWWAPSRGGLRLGSGAIVFEACFGDRWITTDHRWRALAGDAWRTDSRGPGDSFAPEILDARALPARWRESEFDDTGWTNAIEVDANHLGFGGRHEPPSHPYGPLLPRPVALLCGETRLPGSVRCYVVPDVARRPAPFEQVVADLAVTAGPPTVGDVGDPVSFALDAGHVGVAVFDFGEIVAGGVEVLVRAPAGSTMDLAFFEFAGHDGRPTPSGERSAARYVTRGAHDRFESFDTFGLRHLALSVRSDGPATIEAVRVHERLYPRDAGVEFRCSDPRLDRIWAVGRRTVDLNSHDAYIDCPTREQRAWTGDAVVHQMVDLATRNDWRLACWNTELAASPRPDGMLPMAVGGDVEWGDYVYIPDWALHWVRSVHNLYRYMGDRDLVARLLPVAERVLRWFTRFQGPDGLLRDVTGWVLIDWSSVSVAGRSSALNGLFGRALLDFAEMSEWLDDRHRAAWARGLHMDVRAGFEAFWDAERQLYVDNIPGTDRGRATSQHAQAAAIVGGLAPLARHARLVEVLTDRARLVHAAWSRPQGDARNTPPGPGGMAFLFEGPPAPWWDVEKQVVAAQPFFRYVVHDALTLAGRTDLIPDLCLDWEALLERCATSWGETWYGGTVCHGWSATPTRDLTTRTLGVTPAVPGFAQARVAPRLGRLEWARGVVPTPAGPLTIAVTRSRIEIDSPVPFVLDLSDGPAGTYNAGRHVLTPP